MSAAQATGPSPPSADEEEGVFASFPPELLSSVFHQCSIQSLHRLAFVCRHFREAVCHPAIGLKQQLYDKAFVEIDRQDNPKAIAILDTLLNLYPNFYEAWKERAGCWMDENNAKRAWADLLRAEATCTSVPYSHLIQSQKFWVRGENEIAWQHVNKACLADPSEPRFLHFRGYIQSTLSKGQDDVESQEKELADYMHILNTMKYKRKAVIHNNLGYIKYEQRLYDDALKHFSQAIALCPDHAQAHYNQAVVFGDLNQFDSTIDTCNFIIANFPKVTDAWTLRGWSYIYQSNYEQAERDYKRSVYHVKGNIPSSHVVSIYFGLKALLGHMDDALEQLATLTEKFRKLYLSYKLKEELPKNQELGFFYKKRWKDYLETLKSALVAQTEMFLLGGEVEKAKAGYDELVALDSKTTHPFLALAMARVPIELAQISQVAKSLSRDIFVKYDSPNKLAEIMTLISAGPIISLESTSDVLYFLCSLAFKFVPLYFDRRNGAAISLIQVLLDKVGTRLGNASPSSAAFYSPPTLMFLFEYTTQFGAANAVLEDVFGELERISLAEWSRLGLAEYTPTHRLTLFTKSNLLALVKAHFEASGWINPFQAGGEEVD